jgi:hypothetical protein
MMKTDIKCPGCRDYGFIGIPEAIDRYRRWNIGLAVSCGKPCNCDNGVEFALFQSQFNASAVVFKLQEVWPKDTIKINQHYIPKGTT